MTDLAKEIYKCIDSISPVDRAALIEVLFRIFDSEVQREIGAKCAQEIEPRIDTFK